MSGPTPTGNSCSLEDCYTNIFALTDICGIKWRRLCIDPVHTNIDPFEDPVLSSYSKCLQADILCVWKRMVKHSESRPTDLSYGKELWIFWYGDQPNGLDHILSPVLKETENGSWEKDNVMSYECRTLLFKALHNLIERCLMSKDFIRLGKWFVQPQEQGAGMEQRRKYCNSKKETCLVNLKYEEFYNLSFCFNFFLHGESTVCASIEVKQHPPVMFLTNSHINHLQESQSQIQVILAPYGLNGTLTGVTYRDSDMVTRKHLEEWKQFYSVKTNEVKDTDMNSLPNLVEVVVGGVRMKYPSCFVLLVDELHQRPPVMGDTGPVPRQNMLHQPGAVPNGHLTPPTSPEDALHAGLMSDMGLKMMYPMYNSRPPEPVSELTARTNGLLSSRLIERVHQDSCSTAGQSKVHSEGITEDSQPTTWAFADPSSRINCNCPRTKASKNKANISQPGKPVDKKKGDKMERQHSRFLRTTPFHRRAQAIEDFVHHDMDAFMPRGPANTGCVGNSGGSQVGAGGAAPPVQPISSSDTVNINSVGLESPASIAPSPLEESHNQNQLENGASLDPTMPTLSPHPPVLKHGEKDSSLSKHLVQSDQNTNTSNVNNNIVNNSIVNGINIESGVFHHKSVNMAVMKSESLTSLNSVPYSWGSQPVLENMKANNINSWLRSQQKQVDYSKSFKRPVLPTLEGDEDELITETLYNFDPVHNWSNFPLKKVCYDKTEHLNGLQDARLSSNNLGQNHKQFKPPTPQPPAPDPYAFSDESSNTPATISRGSMRNSRDDMFQRPSPFKEEDSVDPTRTNTEFEFKQERNNMDFGPVTSPPTTPGNQTGGSLTRTVDLIPQQSDLDKLFDSDSDSNDEAFVAESPAGQKGIEDTKSVKLTNTGQVDVIAPSELSRMYPTPPSLENNPALSPMTSIDAPMDTTVMEGITFTTIKTEVIVGSLTEELTKVGKSVYKPDACALFPSSSKYAPVDLYSSQLSPPPEVPDYKPSWQYGMALMDKQHAHISHYMNIPSIENLPSIPSARMPSSAIEASPAAFQNSVGQQKTPLSYELQSPASNASSYLKTPQSNINHHIGTNNQIAEAHSLFVNIVLSDSMLNLFKDHSFDNCNICVCNMTIKGADLGLYIPNPTGEQEYKCTCGFSAVMNKRFGCNAGLFYEDEVDITGLRDERFEARKPSLLTVDCNKVDESGNKISAVEEVSQVVLQLILGQYCVPYPTCSTVSLLKQIDKRLTSYPSSSANILQLQDGNEATYGALDQGRQAMEHCHPNNKLEDNVMKSTCLHKWTHLQGPALIPQNSVDSLRLLKSLQPLLQDAIQNKRVTRLWEHTYKLQGPLTWIEFHQLAGRGADENSEPQPIPSLLVGCEKDSSHVSPFAVRWWDKNLMEPYGHRRDIAYVIVTPDNDFVMNGVRTFFKELSTVYEWSRLGRHSPVSDILRDGILRVGKSTLDKVGDLDCDEWFKYIGNGDIASKLRLYAKACKHQLAPFLAQQDPKTIFASTKSSQRASHHRPPEMNSNPENVNNSSSEERENVQGENGQRESHDDLQDNHDCPAIVIYLINPFTYAQEWDDLNRLAVIGLLKCYQEIVPKLPEIMQSNVYLQIVPLQTIVDFKDSSTQFQLLKNIAFSVFTSCRWNLSHNVMGRSLTGFGPAAAAEIILKGGEKSYKLYSPPFILAPLKDKQEQLAESCNEKKDDSTILMCVYCLSEDQRWLLACCTDERGGTVETCTINIDIPNRNRRKKTSARKIALGKLWEFIQGVISLSCKPCRVVIGRFGRIGHGELKGWSGLLSKKNIQQCSKKMKETCLQCSYQTNGDYPYIVSACLTSIEQQNSFHVLPDCVNPEEKQGSNCPLQTPRDCSCSHILVFPTSATAQAQSNQIQLDSTGGIDLGGHNLEFGVDLSDFETNNDDFGSLMDVFVSMTNSPPGSPRQDNPGSPGMMDLGRSSPNKMNGISMTNQSAAQNDPQDDPNLLQQPLAMGYYISTAPTGPLPKWFWSACPENELSPVKCFKSALHIHSSTNQDDFMHQANTRNTHPLDSNLTCDVLRFVLEKYNALSWLTFNPARNDRQSCLPIHFMVLMQMYHAMNAFV